MPSQTTEHAAGGEGWRVDRRGLDLLKRAFDLSAAVVGLLLFSPLLGVIAVLIKRDSPGPVFYRGRRAGRGGREFDIFKFRTMYETAESYAGAPITAQGDSRVTPLGRILRYTKLNELPQLWNVLKGEMSLVGPRPEDPQIAAGWQPELRAEILSVRPGITSPASIQYRREEQLLAAAPVDLPADGRESSAVKPPPPLKTYLENIVPDKLRLDQLYVRHRSFWLDIDTLMWTSVLLLPRLGSTTPREGWLLLGPLSRFMRRYLNWFIIDTLVSFVAVAAAGIFYRTFGPLHVGELHAALVALAFALIFGLTASLLGIHRIHWSKASPEDAFILIPVAMTATLIALAANRSWSGNPTMPPGMVMLSGFLAMLGFTAARYRWRLVRSFARRLFKIDVSAINARERVLIIGAGEAGQFVAYLLNQRRTENALAIIGFVDDDLYMQGSSWRGLNVVGSRQDIAQLVEKHDVGVIVFAIHNIDPQEREEILEICAATPARIVHVPDIGAMLGEIVHGGGGEEAVVSEQ